MKRDLAIPLLALACWLTACGDDTGTTTETAGAEPQATPGTAQPVAGDHGAAIDLGTLTVAGRQFGIARLGELLPGVEGAFAVHPVDIAPAELATLGVYLWIESQDGTQLSAPAKADPEGDAMHVHVTPRQSEKPPFRVVLRLREGGTDARASLPLDGHGHEHEGGPHHGVPAAFAGAGAAGHLELKLHDDNGDLELWLAQDAAHSRPFDLPLDATVEVEFVDVGGRKVTLRPRDTTTNADEAGNANIRDGKTNYFVWPGRDGEDTGWLRGAQFHSIVVVRFARDGQPFASAEFVLTPHAH